MNPPTEDVLGEGTVGGLKLSDIMKAQYEGLKGETIFAEPYVNLLDHEAATKSRDTFVRLGAYKDDRSMALIAAMVCEAYIDRLLSSIMPGYVKNIAKNSNFTFSSKIKILQAFDIVPRHLCKAADLVREVRNEFAHNLDIDALESIDPKIIDRLVSYTASRNVEYVSLKDCRATYDFAVQCATSGLAGYLVNVRDFNSAVRQPDFESMLNTVNQQRRKVHIDAIMQHLTTPPVEDSHDEPF